MRRTAAVAAGAAFLFSAGTAAPAVAVPSGSPVLITAHTSLVNEVAPFDSSIDGCETGAVVNGDNATAHFTPWAGCSAETRSSPAPAASRASPCA